MKALKIKKKDHGKFITLKEDFIVYKAVKEAIVQLLLPKGTIISVPWNYNIAPVRRRTLRADKAIVVGIFPFKRGEYLKIRDVDTEFDSIWDRSFTYKIGQVVKPSAFYKENTTPCSAGIHFFCDRLDAEKWGT